MLIKTTESISLLNPVSPSSYYCPFTPAFLECVIDTYCSCISCCSFIWSLFTLCFQFKQTTDPTPCRHCICHLVSALTLACPKCLEMLTLLNSSSFLRWSPPFPPTELLVFLQIFIEYLTCAGSTPSCWDTSMKRNRQKPSSSWSLCSDGGGRRKNETKETISVINELSYMILSVISSVGKNKPRLGRC